MTVQSARRDSVACPSFTSFKHRALPLCARMRVILRLRSHETLLTLTRLGPGWALQCGTGMIADMEIPPAADADTASLFSAPYAPPDEVVAAILLGKASRAPEAERRIDAYARRLIEGIRARAGGLGGIEDFLHAFSLSTKE